MLNALNYFTAGSMLKMTEIKGSSRSTIDIAVSHKELDEISCSICMEYPHNAVLLLCSSYEKGCRSYICDTSYRHSNCLDRFKKLQVDSNKISSEPRSSALDSSHVRNVGQNISRLVLPQPVLIRNLVETDGRSNLVASAEGISVDTLGENSNSQEHEAFTEARGEEQTQPEESGGSDAPETSLKCPLCRGVVMDWMIVKEAREFLNLKPRSCSRDSCSFSGNYKELRRHARRIHPATRPADIDPSRQRAWRRLEHQREYGDIVSAIRSAMPGAIVLGDYVIDSGNGLSHDREHNSSGEDAGSWWTTFFLLHMINNPVESLDEPRGSLRAWRTHRRSGHRNLWGENLRGMQDDDEDNIDDIPIPRRRRRLLQFAGVWNCEAPKELTSETGMAGPKWFSLVCMNWNASLLALVVGCQNLMFGKTSSRA
ncbi:hypothetical protein ZIOFF_040058 [Zingiber officinale]|uniref:Uncharacterized protein n=1 Tax=Zingiber officinale TaxID=94328 RepID=A0A8J5L491_ZINOF|nr:hypothetical protein ZIOFF_040058 [Zingiber officinale]